MPNYNDFPTVTLTELQEKVICSDFDIIKLDHLFEIESLRPRVLGTIDKHPPIKKDGYLNYLGLGLQYSDDSDSIYDAVQQILFIDPSRRVTVHREPRFKSKMNTIGQQFPELFDYLRPDIRPSRTRILIAKPGFEMAPHQDGAQCATLHLAIQTAPGTKFFVEDREYHIPSDGHLYVVNVGRTHHVENHSDIDRIHITVPLTPFSFRHWTQELALELKPYAEMYGYKFEPMVEFLLSLDPSVDHIERPKPKPNP